MLIPIRRPFRARMQSCFYQGSNQVQAASIFRDEQHGHPGLGDQGGLRLPRDMRAQITGDQHPLPCGILQTVQGSPVHSWSPIRVHLSQSRSRGLAS
jgi:hypothetical protein